MQKILVLLGWLLYSTAGITQTCLVTLNVPEGAPEVALNGQKLRLDSVIDGYTRVKLPCNQKHSISIACKGFKTIRGAWWIAQDTTLMLNWIPLSVTVSEVVISGIRAGRDAPATLQNISRQELNRNNVGQDLPVLLDFTPSAVSTSDAGVGIGYTGIRVRGSDATRINVTINGVPVNDAESQAVFWVNLPDIAASAGQMQIQRGVGTSTNGPAAFGASLNISTREPEQKPWLETGHFAGSFLSFRNYVALGTGLIQKHFFAEGRFSRISSNGYIERAASSLWSYEVSAGYVSKKTRLKFIHFSGKERTYQAWYGVPQDSMFTNRRYNLAGTDWGQLDPPYAGETDNYQQQYFQLVYQQQLQRNWRLQTTAFATLGKGYYEQYKVAASLSDYLLPYLIAPSGDTVYQADVIRRRWLDNVFGGLSWSLDKKWKTTQMVLGGMGAYYAGKHFGKLHWIKGFATDPNRKYYEGTSGKTDVNVYWKINQELGAGWSLYADLQYRFIRHETRGTNNDLQTYALDKTWHFFNPKAGVSWRMNAYHRAYLGYAMANREPNRDDLLDALSVKLPKPELLHNLEAGYQFAHNNFPINVNGYLMYYQDQLVLTGRLNDVGGAVKVNVPRSYRAGIEIHGQYRLLAMQPAVFKPSVKTAVLVIDYGLTYAQNKIKQFTEVVTTYNESYEPVDSAVLLVPHANTDIAFSPSVTAYLTATASPLPGMEISWMFKAVGKQFLDNTSSENRKLDPYWFSNLRLSYDFSPAPLRSLKLSLSIHNLFNRLYSNNGYTFSERYLNGNQPGEAVNYNYYYPQAGIQFYGGITAAF